MTKIATAPVNTPAQVLFASLVGTTIEFFDFYIYATAAVLVFPKLFFPASDPASAVLASLVIGQFEGAIEKIVVLAVLMPIVASMGGNAGTQTVTVAVRSLATGQLTAANALRFVAPFWVDSLAQFPSLFG